MNDKNDNDQQKQNGQKNEQLEQVKQELADLTTKFAELENRFKRAVADYHNLEKRVAEGKAELTNWVSSGIISSILPSLNHLDQALIGATEEEKKSGWFKGVEMAVKQLKQVLKEEGLDEIASDGQFDPTRHEAIDTTKGEDNKIISIVEKGYTLHGKVLKPAKVVVGKSN